MSWFIRTRIPLTKNISLVNSKRIKMPGTVLLFLAFGAFLGWVFMLAVASP